MAEHDNGQAAATTKWWEPRKGVLSSPKAA